MQIFVFLILLFILQPSIAQEKKNVFTLSAEIGVPVSDFSDFANTGFGGSAKVGFQAGRSGQIVVSVIYTRFKMKEITPGLNGHFSIVPFLIGYRHFFGSFYLEQQFGLGLYSARTGPGDDEGDSESRITFASGIGYNLRRLNIGLRYQTGKPKYSTIAFSIIGINIGFNMPFSKPVTQE